MTQRQVFELPPNHAKIEAAFPMIKGRSGILYSYGDCLYNPDKVIVPPWLVIHESIHEIQQRALGPDMWWDRYLTDSAFRLQVEVEACREEFKAFCGHVPAPNRIARARHRDLICERLASGAYGYMIRKKDAKALLLRDA